MSDMRKYMNLIEGENFETQKTFGNQVKSKDVFKDFKIDGKKEKGANDKSVMNGAYRELKSDVKMDLKESAEEYTVWVGGGEVNDSLLSKSEAEKLANEYRNDGYEDVQIEKLDESNEEEVNIAYTTFEVGQSDEYGTWYYESKEDGDVMETGFDSREDAIKHIESKFGLKEAKEETEDESVEDGLEDTKEILIDDKEKLEESSEDLMDSLETTVADFDEDGYATNVVIHYANVSVEFDRVGDESDDYNVSIEIDGEVVDEAGHVDSGCGGISGETPNWDVIQSDAQKVICDEFRANVGNGDLEESAEGFEEDDRAKPSYMVRNHPDFNKETGKIEEDATDGLSDDESAIWSVGMSTGKGLGMEDYDGQPIADTNPTEYAGTMTGKESEGTDEEVITYEINKRGLDQMLNDYNLEMEGDKIVSSYDGFDFGWANPKMIEEDINAPEFSEFDTTSIETGNPGANEETIYSRLKESKASIKDLVNAKFEEIKVGLKESKLTSEQCVDMLMLEGLNSTRATKIVKLAEFQIKESGEELSLEEVKRIVKLELDRIIPELTKEDLALIKSANSIEPIQLKMSDEFIKNSDYKQATDDGKTSMYDDGINDDEIDNQILQYLSSKGYITESKKHGPTLVKEGCFSKKKVNEEIDSEQSVMIKRENNDANGNPMYSIDAPDAVLKQLKTKLGGRFRNDKPFPKLYVQSYNIESELKDAGITNINKG